MKLHYVGMTFLLGLVLAGCESRMDLANQEMERIRQAPPKQPDPIPVFSPVPSFIYDAQDERSPFMPSSIAHEIRIMAGRRVYPNEHRPKGRLEAFALESLLMKGTMNGQSGIEAIIQLPTADKEMVTVRRGDYLGPNHGRIVKITPMEIDLVEIVPDGRGNYVERPRTLVLLEAVKTQASK